jgi:hypothetical protein
MFSDLNEGQEEANEKISMMISQADEQLKNGTLNMNDYRALLREVNSRSLRRLGACSNVFQVVQINEANKLREAQRRDEQENWADSSSWQDEDSQGILLLSSIKNYIAWFHLILTSIPNPLCYLHSFWFAFCLLC